MSDQSHLSDPDNAERVLERIAHYGGVKETMGILGVRDEVYYKGIADIDKHIDFLKELLKEKIKGRTF